MKRKTCTHSKITPEADFAYCPDCGELIENQWYIVRCSCCGVKLKGMIKNGQIVPEGNFCHNCGEKSYVIERINKINFIDISYAVLVKAVIENDSYCKTQTWADFRKTGYRPLLLQQCQ